MKKFITLVIVVLIFATIFVGTKPTNWRHNYVGMDKDTVFQMLGRPDQTGFEEFYWTMTFEILGFNLFGRYLALKVSPGQNQELTPKVTQQDFGVTVFGMGVLPTRE